MTNHIDTPDVSLADITTNYPIGMTPTNIPPTQILERSIDEETAIPSPDPKLVIDPITSSIEEEDDQDVVDGKRSANTIKHYLLAKEEKVSREGTSPGWWFGKRLGKDFIELDCGSEVNVKVYSVDHDYDGDDFKEKENVSCPRFSLPPTMAD
ncbi:unnamed protein product [Orchesella dallaii]|uniref:Uncharacterized protein n=1 Tax=Orchesella dallaii TaxID=48710 RepID=A0ABP1R903_9HEXA